MKRITFALLLTLLTSLPCGQNETLNDATKKEIQRNLIALHNTHNQNAMEYLYKKVHGDMEFYPLSAAEEQNAIQALARIGVINQEGTVPNTHVPFLKKIITTEMLPGTWDIRVIVKGHGWMDKMMTSEKP